MKKIITISFISLFFLINNKQLLANSNLNYPKGFSEQKNTTISFLENKGQVHDQNNKTRPDVLFSGVSQGMVFHLKNNGVSYQLTKLDSLKKESILPAIQPINKLKKGINTRGESSKYITSTIYRLDINWLNINANASITKGRASESFNNYYSENCPNGALNVKSFEDITYTNIYNGIDLKWYQQNGQLKYDYIVGIGADYHQIQFEINGASDISINSKGELELKTPLGTIIEHAPSVTQNGNTLPSSWKINKNRVSFNIQNIKPNQSFIIDPPVRVWGTYYGGNGGSTYESGFACTCDALGNVFLTGYSNSITNIATLGSHQSVFGTGFNDAFLVKFNSGGIRQWGTYYGGTGLDEGKSCYADGSGNIYLAGTTNSSGGIATLGALNISFLGGTFDAFLVKFNSAGVRQWGTYYGSTGYDVSNSCCTDGLGNVYLAGLTDGLINIATVGSHQPVHAGALDAFLVKFNSAGTRLWATYYGDVGYDSGNFCVSDGLSNVYLAGNTDGFANIATAGSHQPAFGGGFYEAFLIKFDAAGIRQWGTYYGGTDDDLATSCCTDVFNNVYLAGYSYSIGGTDIATVGSHQSAMGISTSDAYLVKFNTLGVRQWGTFYGGNSDDYGYGCTTDPAGNVYLVGTAGSTDASSIANAGGHQTTIGGGFYDAFIVQFNALGVRQWASYYGGATDDAGVACCTDATGNIYLAGNTGGAAANVISTAGSHQDTYGGGNGDAFLVQFYDILITLPVELTEFSGIIKNETVLLNWNTQTETNNKLFEIEKSTNGIDFTKIGELEGNNNSRTLSTYNFTDENPINGVNYYRLKQIDNNGSSKNSSVVEINFNKEVTSFYPNPANDYLVFKTKSKSQKVSIKNLFGVELISKLISLNDNTIDLKGFSEGFYIVTLDGETQSLIIKK